ncbi:hypothetical protein GQ44DRAFT_305899 [Phaeosphaeriaceae sp. PMI808]|nr:hypothetical protein GQ44DRAFT_305899 [Phaeosphaeriaceae sp. PMI808]
MRPKAMPQLRAFEPQCASLPPEVWINIFRYHTDLAHLWTVCRRISSTHRACAEHAFAEYFLIDIHIAFQLEKHNLGGKSKRPEVLVTFDRLGKSGDKGTVWFRDKRPKITVCDGNLKGKKADEQFSQTMRRWQENVDQWKPEMPNYIISIRGLVNDVALPDVKINIEEREIQFEWRKMLQLFYREHEQALALKHVWHTKTVKQLCKNQARLAKGEKLSPADYPLPWPTAEAEIRKQVRRARLKESYSHDEQMLWAIDSLKHFENYGAASGHARALKIDPDLPGAGLGEKWFGSVNLVQELYLDEWSCMHRIDTKIEHLRAR